MKKVVFVFIVLCSLQFFMPIGLPETVLKLTEWVAVGILAFLLILNLFYGREESIKKRFGAPIIIILISTAISMFAASAYHDQSFLLTAITQRALYFYLAYFVLHFLKLPGEFIVKTILFMGMAYIVIYLIQYNLYPVKITGARIMVDRGTLRIGIPGAGYFVVAYFIWLYFAFRTWKPKYFIFLFLSLIVLVLLGTRQMLASIILLTIIFILRSRVVKSKVLLFFLIGSISIPIFIMFQEIFLEMLDVTRSQSQAVESNVRVEATKFFLTEYMPSKLAYFTGNGAWGNSRYGLQMTRIINEYGYYQSDIGLIGEYTKFGILFVIGVLTIFFRVFRAKIPEKLDFIKYNYLGILMTLVTGGGAFGSSGANILINCTLLYLIDLYMSDKHAFDKPPFIVDQEAVEK